MIVSARSPQTIRKAAHEDAQRAYAAVLRDLPQAREDAATAVWAAWMAKALKETE